MKQIIKKEGLPDVVFHSLRHTSVTYKLKLSGGDIKAVQGDSGHAQADMVTEVYGHILDEDRKKNAQLMENAFYNKENLNPDIHGASGTQNNNNNNMISVPEGADADMLMKVLGNPEMAALLTSLAKSMNLNDPPEMVHRSTKNMKKNTRRGLYYITPEFQEEICQASFRELSPRFRQPLLFHSTSI